MFLRNYKYTIILILMILVVVGYGGYNWYENKMKIVEQGLADPKFPFRQYTILEIVRQGKAADLNTEERAQFEQELKNLPTRTTPLETFDTYIQALKDGDIEKAADCLEKKLEAENREEYRRKGIWLAWKVPDSHKEYLYTLQREGRLEELIADLEKIKTAMIPQLMEIKRGSIGKAEVRYKYECSWNVDICYFMFVKDLWGDWKIYDPYL